MANAKTQRKPIVVPDLLGEDGRQRTQDGFVARMLAGLQEEEERLHVLQRVNGQDDDDLIPGEPTTYTDRRVQIDDQKQRIAAAFPDAMDRIGAQ